jgi:hypothetical protein
MSVTVYSYIISNGVSVFNIFLSSFYGKNKKRKKKCGIVYTFLLLAFLYAVQLSGLT